MEMHKFEKGWLVLSLLLIIGFIATVAYVSAVEGVDMVDDSGGSIDPDNLSDDERFSEPRVEKVGENEYEAYVIARQFIFQPNPIELPEDSRVTFYITSPDVIHGFQIVGTNVNVMAVPGEVSEITVEFDEPAEYGILCNEYCGSAHHRMEGKIIVHPEDEWEGMGGEN